MIGGIVSLISTSIGATLFLVAKNSRFNPMKVLTLDFAIGMMLVASAVSLISPAYSSVHSETAALGFASITAVLLLGVLFIFGLGRILEITSGHSSRAAVFIIAMMLHNFPEGLAAGAGNNTVLSAIALQNIPEGMTTALAFAALGMNPLLAFGGAVASGLIEMLGGFLGAWTTAHVEASLPYLLAFAGGAMMSATLRELWERCREAGWSVLTRKEFIFGGLLVWGMNISLGS